LNQAATPAQSPETTRRAISHRCNAATPAQSNLNNIEGRRQAGHAIRAAKGRFWGLSTEIFMS
jgi:hypothetical protein